MEESVSDGQAEEPIIMGHALDLGVEDYRCCYQRQHDLVDERKVGRGIDTVLVVEHPHVITVGRSREARGNVLTPGEVDVVEIERGGDATYHGPGQIVAYPIVLLLEGERDLHAYLRNLEEAMISTLRRFGLDGTRVAGKTGVWIKDRKIASIGVACRRWVTFHGLALNVNTDLDYFHRINPCGFDSAIMTSMSRELGVDVDVDAVKAALVLALGAALKRRFLFQPART